MTSLHVPVSRTVNSDHLCVAMSLITTVLRIHAQFFEEIHFVNILSTPSICYLTNKTSFVLTRLSLSFVIMFCYVYSVIRRSSVKLLYVLQTDSPCEMSATLRFPRVTIT